jgi:membrane protein
MKSWSRDDVPRLGASLAYYTLFSLAPMLIIAIALAGVVFGPEAVRGQIVEQLDGLIGPAGATAVQALLVGASKPGAGQLAVIIGAVTLIVGSSGAFVELQHALNKVFRVKADPSKAGVLYFLTNRIRSFGMVVSIGFLLLTSLAINAALAAASSWFRGFAGDTTFWRGVDFVVSFGVITALFALLLRFVPNVRLGWRYVWTGGLVTAGLFTIGRTLIGVYLGRSAFTSSYGAIGSVLALLVWIYYSAQIVLYGAEVTRQYAEHREGPPKPNELARAAPEAHPTAERGASKGTGAKRSRPGVRRGRAPARTRSG